jgi:4'-phosphopantetheinyl transferase
VISITAIKNSSVLDDRLYASFLELVSPERKQRAARFLRREDACRCIIGEVLAKYCIALREHIPLNEIIFQADEFGKPRLASAKTLDFNISHSKSWVVCAVDKGPVGIDVEHLRKHDIDIAKRFFHPDEYAMLCVVPEEEKKAKFYEFWTLKESYIKAIGKGLSCPLSSFGVYWENGRIGIKTVGELPTMVFKQYDLGADYKCSACALHDDFPDEIEIMTPEELLETVFELSTQTA